jgi:type VI secretion system secreted protein Hcp
MAMDLFLKIDDLKGESTDVKHKGEIQLLSWTWGVSRTSPVLGGSAGKAQVQEVRFTKAADKSTPSLVRLCCSGKQIKQAVLVVRGGTKALEYLKVTFEDAAVSSFTTGGTGPSDDVTTDTFSLTFARMKVEYTPQGEAAVVGGWNFLTNEDWS